MNKNNNLLQEPCLNISANFNSHNHFQGDSEDNKNRGPDFSSGGTTCISNSSSSSNNSSMHNIGMRDTHYRGPPPHQLRSDVSSSDQFSIYENSNHVHPGDSQEYAPSDLVRTVSYNSTTNNDAMPRANAGHLDQHAGNIPMDPTGMYRNGGNRIRMDGNAYRGQLPPMHSYHQHAPDGRQPFDYNKSSRPPMQHQSHHLIHMPHHPPTGRHQPFRSQQPYHPGYNQTIIHEYNRRNHFVDDRHLSHGMNNGLHPPQFDHRRIPPQMYSNQDGYSVGRGGGGGGFPYSRLPPRHDDYDSYSRSSNNRMAMDNARHHRNLSGSSLDTASQGSGIGLGNGNPQQGGPYPTGRGLHRHDMGLYAPPHMNPEEPVMNGNDGDPYSVGNSNSPNVLHRPRINNGNDGIHHASYMPLQPPMATIRNNNDMERACDMNHSAKGMPKIPMNPHMPYAAHTMAAPRRSAFDIPEDAARAKMGMPMQPYSGPPQQSFVRSNEEPPPGAGFQRDPMPSQVNPRLVYNIKFKRTIVLDFSFFQNQNTCRRKAVMRIKIISYHSTSWNGIW